MRALVLLLALAACSEPTLGKPCGTDGGVTCGPGEYCALEPGAACGDTAGVCRSLEGGCVLILSPECGCDHRVYGNFCAREQASVALLPGTCGPPCDPAGGLPRSCGTDGVCTPCGCLMLGSGSTCGP